MILNNYKFRKLKLAMAFLSLFALVSMVQKTYMKYNSSAGGNTNFNIARWQIAVNNKDIIKANDVTNVITPVIIKNNHVRDGKIAPLSTGYFDLVLDYTNVDISFKLKALLDNNVNNDVKDFKVTSYSLNGGEIIPVNNNLTIEEKIYLSNPERVKTIRVYVKWLDGVGEIMNNEDDTNATLNQKKASISVQLNFVQINN